MRRQKYKQNIFERQFKNSRNKENEILITTDRFIPNQVSANMFSILQKQTSGKSSLCSSAEKKIEDINQVLRKN